MAISFYNAGDNAIYDSGQHFVPQEKYRLGYTPPATPEPLTNMPVNGGITNTKAFNNSGGGNFNFGSGNAFGYGSPVNEVNVRTFNPQSNDPTGSVANAQEAYNQFEDVKDKSIYSNYNDINNLIQDNRQNYGAQGQYKSPYDDTVDLGYKGRDTSTSLRRNKFGNIIDTVTNFIPGVGMAKKGIKFLGGLLPQGNDNGPGGGTYGIGGLSDTQKEAYNTLAGQGMLFNGQNGFKTLTGKNFTGKGYMEGQEKIYKDKFAEMNEDEIAALTGFQKKQYLEASLMYKTTQKQKKEAEEQKKQNEIEAKQAAIREKEYASQGKSDPNDQSRTGSSGRRPGSGGNVERRDSGPDRNTDSGGTTYDSGGREGFGYGLKEGGRAGYFFGGRVNYKKGGRVSFKNGGLASIL
jgi:hypothetical protein